MDYIILQNEMLPVALQNKPQWVTFIACAAGLLMITLSAVTVGAFIGYTYCYLEHRSGFRTGNFSHTTKLEVIRLPSQPEYANKDTINNVLYSLLVSRLIKIGQSLKYDAAQVLKPNNSSLVQNNATSKCFQK